jgi:Uma2 family endonuclease
MYDQIHRYSVDEYEELVAKGGFEDQRVELVDGLVLDMSPKSPAHENGVAWLLEWLVGHVDLSRYQVRVCASIRIDPSEPEPDLMVIDRSTPRDRHATHALLVIEVALSSRERDLTIKPRLYAPAVSEYWVLDLERRQVVAHRDPAEDGYRDVTVHGRGASLSASALGLDPLPVGELLDALS